MLNSAGHSDAQRENAALISIRDLNYRYAGTDAPALRNLTLAVPEGGTFGLLGPNGAGKSTLLALLTGLITPPAGAVKVAGHDLARDAARVQAISALVPQDYAFYPGLSARENLEFFAGIYRLDARRKRRQFEYCVDVCRLQDVLDRPAQQYSGGVKRRLNLAIGLLNAPRILYLDEPTVGIDALSRQCIIEAIQALKAEGVTLVYTSHYMEEVEAICDTLAVIDRGRVVVRDSMDRLLQRGSGKQLQLKLQAPPSALLIDELAPFEPRRLDALRWTLQLREGAAQLPQLLQRMALHGAVIEQLQFGVSRLEQVYMALLEGRELP